MKKKLKKAQKGKFQAKARPLIPQASPSGDLAGTFAPQIVTAREAEKVEEVKHKRGLTKLQKMQVPAPPELRAARSRSAVEKAQSRAHAEAAWKASGYHTDGQGNPTQKKLLYRMGEALQPVGELVEGLDEAATVAGIPGLIKGAGKKAIQMALPEMVAGEQAAAKWGIKDFLKSATRDDFYQKKMELQRAEAALMSQYASPEGQRRLKAFDMDVDPTAVNLELTAPGAHMDHTLGIYFSKNHETPILRGRAFVSSEGQFNRFSAGVHEGTHQMFDAPYPYSVAMYDELRKPVKPFSEAADEFLKLNLNTKDLDVRLKAHQYYSDPREVHARINEMRHLINPGNPYKKVEAYELAAFMAKQEELGDVSLAGLREALGHQGFTKLAEVMNKVPVAAPVAVGAAAASQKKKKRKGGVSTEGYKASSPDKDNAFNIIPSNRITMKNVPHPVVGVDNTGHSQMMEPGGEYAFPGDWVVEFPVKGKHLRRAQMGWMVPHQPQYRVENTYLPYLNGFNLAMTAINEKLMVQEQDRYNRQAILLQSQEHGLRHPQGMDKLGNPMAYQVGGDIPEDLSYLQPAFELPALPSGPAKRLSGPAALPSGPVSGSLVDQFKAGINAVEASGRKDYGLEHPNSSAFGPYGFLANPRAALGAVYKSHFKGKMSFNELVNKMKVDPTFHEEVMNIHSMSLLQQAGGDPLTAALLHFHPVSAQKYKRGALDLKSRPTPNNLTFEQYLNRFSKGMGVPKMQQGGKTETEQQIFKMKPGQYRKLEKALKRWDEISTLMAGDPQKALPYQAEVAQLSTLFDNHGVPKRVLRDKAGNVVEIQRDFMYLHDMVAKAKKQAVAAKEPVKERPGAVAAQRLVSPPTPTPSATTERTNVVGRPPRPTNYSFTYRDDKGQQQNLYFPDVETWQHFTEVNSYMSRDKASDGSRAQATGYLRKRQKGGEIREGEELDLTEEEIQRLKDLGYEIEKLD